MKNTFSSGAEIPDNIVIHKNIKILPPSYICDMILDSGVTIHCRSDGSAIGDDGKTYYAVSRDDENGDCETLGYSCDISSVIDSTKE